MLDNLLIAIDMHKGGRKSTSNRRTYRNQIRNRLKNNLKAYSASEYSEERRNVQSSQITSAHTNNIASEYNSVNAGSISNRTYYKGDRNKSVAYMTRQERTQIAIDISIWGTIPIASQIQQMLI